MVAVLDHDAFLGTVGPSTIHRALRASLHDSDIVRSHEGGSR